MLVTDLSAVSSFSAGADAIIGTDLLSLTSLEIDFDSIHCAVVQSIAKLNSPTAS
jgi:hypothetical protein